MAQFKNSTIRKGLERLLPNISDHEERDRALGVLGGYLRENISKSLDLDPRNPEVYKTIDEVMANYDQVTPSKEDIELGKRLYDTLSQERSYSLGLRPDKRKLQRIRRIEAQSVLEILRGNKNE